MKQITLLSIFMLLSFAFQHVKAEIYFDLTTVGGTIVMDWDAVAAENSKAQSERWLTLVAIASGTSGKCGTATKTFDIKTGSSRSITFYLAKCDNLTITANIAAGRGLLVNVNDAATNIQLDGTGACKDYVVPINSETNVKIKVTALTSSSAWTSFFTFSYAAKVPQIATFTAEGISATIDQNAKTIKANLPYGTNLTSITPVVTLNSVATSYTPTGAQDFSTSATTPVIYQATDGITGTDYSVTLTANKNTENSISNLKIDNVVPLFDVTTNTYTLVFPKGTTNLTKPVTFDLPFRATADFTSGNIYDFTNPLKIKVTAENGDQKEYTINVFAASKHIAYVINTAVDAKDTKIRPMLASKYYLENIPIANITTTYDFSTYDMVILTEAPTSGSAGMKALWGINKPLLSLKMYAIQANTWNLSTASNPSPSVTTVTVNEPNHPIFNGVKFSGIYANEIQMFNTISSGNGVQTSPYADNYNIANIKGALTTGILELPVGTASPMVGTTNANLQSKLLIVSISNDNQNIVTDNALKVIDNAVNYLTGTTSWGIDAGTDFQSISFTGNAPVVSATSATIAWNAVPAAVKYIVSQVTASGVKGVSKVISGINVDVPGNETSLELTGLTQSTAYQYNVVAENAAGKLTDPAIITFNTWFTGISATTLKGVTYDGQTIRNNDRQHLYIYNATGGLVAASNQDINMSAQTKGVYLVKGDKGMMKIAVTK